MAIDFAHWNIIRSANAKGKCLSAGYPDFLVKTEGAPIRPDTDVVQKHHGIDYPIADTAAVFADIGLELVAIDREKRQGSEIIVDLNRHQDAIGAFDLVIDPGTTEHCFNVATAAFNLLGAVKLGGYISQAVPMSMFNHGYYNLNPVWFIDCYAINGFEMKTIVMRHKDGLFYANISARLKEVPEEAVIITLAQRTIIKPFEYPQQKC